MDEIGTRVPAGSPLETLADVFTEVMGGNTRWWAEVFGSPLQLVLGSVRLEFLSGPAHPLLVQAPSHHPWLLQPLSLLGITPFPTKGCWQ